MTAVTAKVLWSPSPERVKRAWLTRYANWLKETRGLEFEDYQALWRWSVRRRPSATRSAAPVAPAAVQVSGSLRSPSGPSRNANFSSGAPLEWGACKLAAPWLTPD